MTKKGRFELRDATLDFFSLLINENTQLRTRMAAPVFKRVDAGLIASWMECEVLNWALGQSMASYVGWSVDGPGSDPQGSVYIVVNRN